MKNKLFNLFKNNNIQFSIILFIAFLLLVGVKKNYLENNLATYHDDEIHTVLFGIKTFETGSVDNFRALEGSRWMYRLFYPGALIKMSQNMGGNTVLTAWERTSHNYILNEYIHKDSTPAVVRQRLTDDPNLRDFFYALRLQSLLFVFICFIPLLYYCFRNKYYMALVFLMIFPALNVQLAYEQSYAYIEPLLMGFISIVIWLFLYLLEKKKVSVFMMIFLGFVAAFTISIKFSSLFFVLLLLMLPYFNKEEDYQLETILKKTFIIFGSFAFSFILINYYGFFGNINGMLHDFISNFWNYQNGQTILASDGSTAGFYNNFINLLSDLRDLIGYVIYVLPFVWIFGFYYANKNEKLKFGILTLVLSISFLSLLNQVEFFDRNIVPFYVPFLFVSGIFLSIIIRQFQDKVIFKNSKILNYVVLTLVFIGYIGVFITYKNVVLPNTKNNFQTAIDTIPELQNRSIKFINIDQAVIAKYPNEKSDITTDIYFTNVNYKQKLEAIANKLEYNDVVLVNRASKNYFQYSNFLLPRYYDSNEQFGSYFLFYNIQPGAQNNYINNLIDSPVVLTEQISIQSISISELAEDSYELIIGFDDFFNENLLSNKMLYFHAYSYPDDVNSLSNDRIQYGFENFDIMDINVTKQFGKPVIKKTFTSKLKSFESFRFGLIDLNNNENVITHFATYNIKL